MGGEFLSPSTANNMVYFCLIPGDFLNQIKSRVSELAHMTSSITVMQKRGLFKSAELNTYVLHPEGGVEIHGQS